MPSFRVMADQSGVNGPPPDDELIVGLVGPLGVDLGEVVEELGTVLDDFAYRTHRLHVTDSFEAFEWPGELKKGPYDERIWSYMNAGDFLRERWRRTDAVGLLAINQIAAARQDLTGSDELPSARTAYLVRQFKRPEEIKLLRSVYGSRFVVISAAASETTRLEFIGTKIRRSRRHPTTREPVYSVEQLVRRDESQEPGDWNEDKRGDWGQDVRDTFHRADFFVDIDRNLKEQLNRVFSIFHGDPKRAPRRDEFGMFQAFGAARRSADLSRQVGAAITINGTVAAVGTNEVPRRHGGLYWEGDEDDARDVKRNYDANVRRRRQVAEKVAEDLREAGLLKTEAQAEEVLRVMERGPVADVIEYVRAVHAEMSAITDAAQRGASVEGGTLFTTTFPCHHCARHIVATGIVRLVFVSPYPKSLAEELHDDSIVLGTRRKEGDDRVPFEPFFGVGPRRYIELFTHEKRRDKAGNLLGFDPMTAAARIADRDPPDLRSDRLPYLDRERKAQVALNSAERDSGFAMRRQGR